MDIVKITDIVIAVLLIAAVITGYMSGFVMKAAGLMALIASFAAASFIAGLLSPKLGIYINGQVPASNVAFTGEAIADTAVNIAHHIIFCVVFIILFIILRHVANIFKITSHLPLIGKADRICGAVAGFLIDFIVIYIICQLFFGMMPQDILDSIGFTKKAIEGSVLLQSFY